MGGDIRHVIFKVLLPEALPALLAGLTLTLVMLIGFSSMPPPAAPCTGFRQWP